MPPDDAPTPSSSPGPNLSDGGILIARPVAWSIPQDSAPLPAPILALDIAPRAAVFDAIAVPAALLLVESLLGLALPLFLDVPEKDTPAHDAFQREMLIPVLCLRALLVFVLVRYTLRQRGQSWSSIGLGGSRRRSNTLLNVVIGCGCTAAAYGLLISWWAGSTLFWPDWIKGMNENTELLMNRIPRLHPFWFVPLMLTVSLYEEMLFRGFLMSRLRRALRSWPLAVLISTILFTLAHAGDQNHAALPVIAGLAIILSIVTIWRRSLLPAIVGHFLFNLFQILGLYLQNRGVWK